MKLNLPVYGVLNSGKKIKLLKYLLGQNTVPEMSERSLAKMVEISNVSVNRAMKEFESINLAHARFVGGAKVWSVNRESYAYGELRKAIYPENGEFLPVDGLKKKVVHELKKLPVLEAVLYGSVARADEKPGSDIDLFLLVKGNEEKEKTETAVRKLDDRISAVYGNHISGYILTKREYEEKSGLQVIKNIRNEGIRLI